MPAIAQTTLSTLRALPGNLDLSGLDNVDLPDTSALEALASAPGDWVPTSVSPGLLVLSKGDYSVEIAGTGFGPLNSQAAFEAALNTGTATGEVTSIALADDGTALASIAISASGMTLNIGSAALRLDTTLPSSLQGIAALVQQLPVLLDPGSATAQERAQLEAFLSPYILTGAALSVDGTEVLSATLAVGSLTLGVSGINITATGTVPVNLGEAAALLFELSDQLSGSAGVAPHVAFYDETGTELTSFYQSNGADAYYGGGSDVSETIYVGVSVGDGGPGAYQLAIEDFDFASMGVAENGDAGQTPAGAQAVAIDSIVTGTLSSASDIDWYRVETTPFETTYAFVSAATSIDIGALDGLSLDGLTIGFDGLEAGQVLDFSGDVEGVIESVLSGISDDFSVRINGVDYEDVFLDLDTQGPSLNMLEAGNSMGMGYGGADTMFGNAGDDFLDGGLDNDSLAGNQGADTLLGQDGDDRLDGGLDDDSVLGGNGDDTVIGGGGFDTLRGGNGQDRVVGGDGRDLAYLGGGNDLFVDNAQGGAAGRDTVYANAGNDTVGGGNGDDVFHGQGGNDRLLGRLGDDKLFGGDQNDTLVGGAGDDTVAGGNGRDRAFLGDGDDRWFDNGQGGFGSDFVVAGRGNDTIEMHGGDDTASGGEGADAFHFIGGAFGRDVITDYAVGEDRIGIDGGLMSLTQSALDAIADASSGDLVLTFNAQSVLVLEGVTSTAGLLSDVFEL